MQYSSFEKREKIQQHSLEKREKILTLLKIRGKIKEEDGHMERKIYKKLIEWKNKGMKKPLMIIGARQVGKTYIINEFCKNEYKNTVQINLLNHPEIVELYKQNISLEEKYIRLCANLNIF